jgi:prepilin-type N-terminal cleavage/methylation domain-containing protein
MTRFGFTLVETIITIMIVTILIAAGFQIFTAVRHDARLKQSSQQLSGIHAQLVVYAQTNRNWYPGLTRTIEVESGGLVSSIVVDSWGAVSNRYGAFGPLVAQKYITSDDLVSPNEFDRTVNGNTVRGLATSLGSYAVLEYV